MPASYSVEKESLNKIKKLLFREIKNGGTYYVTILRKHICVVILNVGWRIIVKWVLDK
jgi:hypothetical protein